jgi:hypothetical protein
VGFDDVKLIGIKNQTARTEAATDNGGGESLGAVLEAVGMKNANCDWKFVAEVSRKIGNFTLIVDGYCCVYWLP